MGTFRSADLGERSLLGLPGTLLALTLAAAPPGVAAREGGAEEGVPAPAYLGPAASWSRLGLPAPDLSPGARSRYEVRRADSAPARFEVAVERGSLRDRLRLVLGYRPSGAPAFHLELDLAPRRDGGASIDAVRLAAPEQPPLALAVEEGDGSATVGVLGGLDASGTARILARDRWLDTPAGRFRAAHLLVHRPGAPVLELWVALGDEAPPFHVLRAREDGVETVLLGWERGGRPIPEAHGTGSDQAKRKPSR